MERCEAAGREGGMTDVGETGTGPEPRAVKGPLSGYRILDLTTVVLGPYATRILGDMGADVVKVEPPEGDMLREIGPSRSPGMAPIHLALGSSKRSVALDLKRPRARGALLRLAAGADAFVHSMRPGAIARLGLAYEDLRRARPDLVYCGASGFGSGGPYAGRPAYDDLIQGMCGIADLMGRVSGGPPRYAPTIVADKTVGLFVANAVLAALLHRERTGEGQAIEVPMFETMVSYVMVEHLWERTMRPDDGALGYVRMLAPNRRPFRSRDGYLCMLAYTDRHWKSFFALAGRPELSADPRYATISARTENVSELYAVAEELLGARTTAEWLADLEKAEVPAGPVNSLEDLLADPHLAGQGLIRRVDHPSEGETLEVGPPARFSRSPAAVRRPAPLLGEHTVEVLGEAGLDPAEIDALLRDGAAVQSS